MNGLVHSFGELLLFKMIRQEGFSPAYHMSKSSWTSVIPDEMFPDEQIFPLLELSYDSVVPNFKPRRH